MINKILIANRGEIACRIMETCRKSGIKTVAVYSDADRHARHTQMADEAVYIGASQAAMSYLNEQKILDAAKATGADAIHPGYGFLSENAAFVEKCENAGIIFIGPSAKAIETMGVKDRAKQVVREAGVAVVEGYQSDKQDEASLHKAADEIGYPLLIKAVAGGGGKGMRQVMKATDFSEALQQAKNEAKASFSDDRVMLEKYIAKARHIEVQIIADKHGNCLYLFERDCSAQRRYQKVIEEAPAPGVSESLRHAMGQAAVAVARQIDYVGAGTIEFIVDAQSELTEKSFYFMEMNTRLQVEHPVTEAITGVDLVALQISVAAGQPLKLKQQDLQVNGWAIEARIYAEDVAGGFLPSVGTIHRLNFPQHNVRVDTGVRQGDEISAFYDPMIAKMIVHAGNRQQAIRLLKQKLSETALTGCQTNIAFLSRLLSLPAFSEARLSTTMIDAHIDALTSTAPMPVYIRAAAAIALLGYLPDNDGKTNGNENHALLKQGFRPWGQARHLLKLQQVQSQHAATEVVIYKNKAQNAFRYEDGNETLDFTLAKSAKADFYQLTMQHHRHQLQIILDKAADMAQNNRGTSEDIARRNRVTVFAEGDSHTFEKHGWCDDADAQQAGASSGEIKAPMPGTIIKLSVSENDTVTAGQELLTMEAMKLHMVLKAEQDGQVEGIFAAVGDQVGKDKLLIKIAAQ